jgi:5-formyltetrahydrofolate cyclo-ligase
LLLWFESNGSHRHMRVALPDSTSLRAARRSLRAALNARRRELSPADRAQAAQRVARNADRALHLQGSWRIAAYAALPWELDATPLVALAASRGSRIYLPRIARSRSAPGMRFVELRGPSRHNRFGIAEPVGSGTVGARWLDVVFLPLVGFDRCGLRLGTGGGFYDRAFEFRHYRRCWRGPLLVGVAYAFQEVEGITPAPHDVPMDMVVTETEIIRCATG